MPDLMTFGGRLRDARKEAKVSAAWMVEHLNKHLVPAGLARVHINTYYSWEKIGTPGELKSGKRYPHPMAYKIMLDPLGITGYWLWYGDMGGRVIRRRKDLPQEHQIADEQIGSIREIEEELYREFKRVAASATNAQKTAILNLLRAIR